MNFTWLQYIEFLDIIGPTCPHYKSVIAISSGLQIQALQRDRVCGRLKSRLPKRIGNNVTSYYYNNNEHGFTPVVPSLVCSL
jgi:hypothetical protein